jgi:hypothetical protein
VTEQDITPYVNWTKNMLRNDERPAVARLLGIREWTVCFSATAARVDRFLQLGHEGSKTLPQSLVLDIIELDQAALTDALDAEGLLKNFVFFWSAVADVYGSTGTSSQIEAKRLDLLVEWSLLLTALPGSGYPGVKPLAPRYRHERARLALTKLRKEKTDFAHVASGLQLVQEQEARLGMRWDMQSAAFTRIEETAGRGLESRPQPGNKSGGKLVHRDAKFPVAASIVRAAQEPILRFELYGNWRDHWRNTMP